MDNPEYAYIGVDVPPHLEARVWEEVQPVLSPGCLFIKVQGKEAQARFVIEVPAAGRAAVEAVLNGIGDLLPAQATADDIQQVHAYREGKAPSQLDF